MGNETRHLSVRIDRPMAQVYAFALETLSGWKILPKHKFAAAVAEKRPYSIYRRDSKPQDVVGTGPFRLKDFRRSEFTLLERNPYYHSVDRKGTRLPYLDEVLIREVEGDEEKKELFLRRQSDVLDWVMPADFEPLQKQSGDWFRIIDLGLELDTEVLVFNQVFIVDAETQRPYPPFVDQHKLKWFSNPKFRKAVSHATNERRYHHVQRRIGDSKASTKRSRLPFHRHLLPRFL